MMITDVMREADTEYVVYFLLSSYLNAGRYGDKPKRLPEKVMALPLRSRADVRSRFEALMLELDAASKRLDDKACVAIKEALAIFGVALNRLQLLDGKGYWPLDLEVKTGPLQVKASNGATTPPQDVPGFSGPAA